jgi:hypothetical protein
MHTPDFTRRYALGKAGDAGVGAAYGAANVELSLRPHPTGFAAAGG